MTVAGRRGRRRATHSSTHILLTSNLCQRANRDTTNIIKLNNKISTKIIKKMFYNLKIGRYIIIFPKKCTLSLTCNIRKNIRTIPGREGRPLSTPCFNIYLVFFYLFEIDIISFIHCLCLNQ